MRRYVAPIITCAFLFACATDARKTEEMEKAEQVARLQAQIERSIDQYQKPQIIFVAGRKAGRYQSYVTSCLTKIIDAGNRNYPVEARGKFYGDVRVTFFVGTSGALQKVELDKSSGHDILDAAIVKAVQLSAPFGKFPPEFGDRISALAITQTFSFSRGDRVEP